MAAIDRDVTRAVIGLCCPENCSIHNTESQIIDERRLSLRRLETSNKRQPDDIRGAVNKNTVCVFVSILLCFVYSRRCLAVLCAAVLC